MEETDRQKREREFHDKWAEDLNLDDLLVREAFEAATAMENRRCLDFLMPLSGKTLLDLGCGAGETSVYFALQGADVTAVDISPEMVRCAEELAKKHGVTIKTDTVRAEAMPYGDGSFDRVFANGVLHHVELEPSLTEVRRILTPDGKAAFIEPLSHNPVIHVYRRLAEANRTEDENPLSMKQIRGIRSIFPKMKHEEFWFFSLYLFIHFFLIERASPSKVRYWKKVIEDADRYAGMFRILKWLDRKALGFAPFLGRYCWNSVIMVEKG